MHGKPRQPGLPFLYPMNIAKLQRRLRPILKPASGLYGLAMRARAAKYARIALPYRAACPVISVGNIAWGGTGKTPVVEYLLTVAAERHLRAVVLTRGYKASPPELPFPVRPLEHDAGMAGDEPLLLARRHPEALVIVDPKRTRAAAWAETHDKPELFILDDGMQHMAVARDCNIVLLRPEDLLDQWNRVIPAGSWREDASALARADAFCIKADESRFSALAGVAEQRLKAFGRPLFSFTLTPSGIVRVVDTAGTAPETAPDLDGAPYTMVCGTGNPEDVRATMESFFGYAPAKAHIFPDHHAYTPEDVARICDTGDRLPDGKPPRIRPVVCTAKDAVKLAPLLTAFGSTPLWSLEVAARFERSLFTAQSFDAWLESVLTRSFTGKESV